MVNLSHPQVDRKVLLPILNKMGPATLTKAMGTCRMFREVVDGSPERFNAYLPTHALMFEIEPKSGMYGIKAESSVVKFSLEYPSNSDSSLKTRLVFCEGEDLANFLENQLAAYTIFRYGNILFKFEKESVMLRVLATLRKYNLRSDEIFYAVCPSLPLAISAIRPSKVGCCCRPCVNWIDCSYKRSIDYVLDRFCLFDNIFELSQIIEDIIDRSIRVELMTVKFTPESYNFVLKFMKKLIREDKPTLELWASITGGPLPEKKFFNPLGEHLYSSSNKEIMVVVIVSETKFVVLNIIEDPLKWGTNLIVRRYSSLEDFIQYYGVITMDPKRHVLSKMMDRYTEKFDRLKIK